MAKVTVYRVEHFDGRGAYHSGTYDVAMDGHTSEHRPGPWEDGLSDFGNLHFGFASREQMLAWWDERQLKQLVEHGCRIAQYAVDVAYVMFGGRQVVFDRYEAELVAAEVEVE